MEGVHFKGIQNDPCQSLTFLLLKYTMKACIDRATSAFMVNVFGTTHRLTFAV